MPVIAIIGSIDLVMLRYRLTGDVSLGARLLSHGVPLVYCYLATGTTVTTTVPRPSTVTWYRHIRRLSGVSPAHATSSTSGCHATSGNSWLIASRMASSVRCAFTSTDCVI